MIRGMSREMEGVEKLFGDLESNDSAKVEESKKKFTEFFSLTKETWLVNGLMDYFIQTQSSRIVDILVKVQTPHDKFIFDRLADWIHGPNKNDAIALFGHIVKKHPSWLHKVASHNLFKEILKLLKTESNIVSLMSALFCIIILLPIIPTSMANYLQELFDVFLYLASWNCNNVPRLTEDQLIHLQIGLSTFFQRLYGMYPCNFISYLKDHVIKEKKSVFIHTIKPLLETVKMHPLLLTANRETEKNNARWKEMEPHDVVVECSKFSLDYLNAVNNSPGCPHNLDWPSSQGFADIPVSVQLQNTMRNTPYETAMNLPFYSLINETKEKSKESQKMDSIWSPTIAVLATPPLTGTIPHTPTPSMSTFNIKTLPGSSQLCPSASPPEAAVEATPETTPLKDELKTFRQFPVNSNAVRAILSSQPSSPLKRDITSFQYTELPGASNLMMTSPKIQTLLNDRNLFQMQYMRDKHHIEIQEVPESAVIKPTTLGDLASTAGNLDVQQITDTALRKPKRIEGELNSNSKFKTPLPLSEQNLGRLKSDGSLSNIAESSSTQEDQEVADIIKIKSQKPDSSYECGDYESEGSPCSAGGLHVPSSLSMQNYAQRFQKWRNRNQSESTTSCKSGETSPTDVNISGSIKSVEPAKITTSKYGDSTPSDDDIKKESKLKSKLLRSKRKSFGKLKSDVDTQTIEQVPQAYEQIFLELFSDENRKKSAQKQPIVTTPLSPHSLLDQYIETSIKKRSSSDSNNRMEYYKDQIQLIHLQLQYERYRREMHAERNRRLLGKSRTNTALQMENEKLREQKDKLAREIEQLTASLNKACILRTSEEKKHLEDKLEMTKKYQAKCEENKTLMTKLETLQRRSNDDLQCKQSLSIELQSAYAEIFNLQNDLQQAQYHAELGLNYKQELNRLQSEVILMGEIQIKCRDKLNEISNLKVRDVEYDAIADAYELETKELRTAYEIKANQLESVRSRIIEQEAQMARRDQMFTEQKRLLKTVKEEYQDKFKALEEKYAAQKAIILRLEEEILELSKNSTAVNVGRTVSPDSEKTDMVGSLEHTSELSLSLASSEGLSNSLRSVTEIKNLHPLIVQPDQTTTAPTVVVATGTAQIGRPDIVAAINISTLSGSARPQVSDDIPVPIPGTSQHHHHNK